MTGLKACPLLLLSFSLVSVGKECPFPSLTGKIVLSSETILRNDFPDNSEAFVECAKGYEREEGPISITCVNGNWSEPKLICKRMDCGPPSPSPHMTYSIPNGTLFGDYIQPRCETGYDLEGSSFRQCLVSGWSGRAHCILTECYVPDKIEHGNMNAPQKPLFNDVITFSCDDGYILIGNSSIKCVEYGDYDSLPPKCKAALNDSGKLHPQTIALVQHLSPHIVAVYKVHQPVLDVTTLLTIECPVLNIPFGNLTEGNPPFFYKSKARFKCWPGYSMKDSATPVCETSGWSPFPVCEVIITPTEARTTTNKPTTTDTILSTHSPGGFDKEPITVFPLLWVPVIVCAVLLCCCPCILCLVFFYSKRKGSYNTGEELRGKEELLLNQSV